MTTYKFRLTDGGDILTVNYDGAMFVAPSSGSQHSTETEAMQMEIAKYMRECGEDGDEYDVGNESEIALDSKGKWID